MMSAPSSIHPVQAADDSERPLRILIISSLFPPFVIGGAEMAAHSLAIWLARNGHTVHVLTGVARREDAGIDADSAGFTIERRFFPNIYPLYQANEKRPIRKLVWHARDHLNPDSESIVRAAIESFRPDIVNTHDIQGIGYNLLREIGRQGLPCVQTLHDFGFICINMNMFRQGKPCRRRHFSCAVSGMVKRSYLSSIERLAFWAPSQSLLDRYRPHLPPLAEAACIQLPLLFSSPPRVRRDASLPVRLLYVGQVTAPKGVEFLLDMLQPLATTGGFEITIVGGGSLLDHLRRRHPWARFTGRVPPDEVAGFMAASDVLMMPSLWAENAPVVTYQAILQGLPMVASRIGGLPELVRDGVNGILLPPGGLAQWQACVRDLLAQPGKLDRLRGGARQCASSYDPNVLGGAVVRLFRRTIGAVATHEEALAV